MVYLEWNNIIAQYFFNSDNAGKDVYLYLTKFEIINLAKQYFDEKVPEEQVWDKFISAIKNGLPGSKGNIVTKARHSFEKRKYLNVAGVEIKFPPYITYLVFFVLPLIEDIDGTYSANNYYGRLNRLLKKYGIEQNIEIADFRDQEINLLWANLERWANAENNGDLGKFRVIPFTNANWIYVGKPFSQCVLPPKAVYKLPELFLLAGMVPNSVYSVSELKICLLKYGRSVLGISNNVIECIKKSDTNELGDSIIEIVHKEYDKWTGESHFPIIGDSFEKRNRNYVVAPLLLQFTLNVNKGTIDFSYRMYSSNDYPDDLTFNGLDGLYERAGFSRKIVLPHVNFFNSFELKDEFNRWIAKFPKKDVRLFISGSFHQLSTNYWLETDYVSRNAWMFLLCANNRRDEIIQWGKHFKPGNFTEESLEGIPNDYSFFKFLNPSASLPEIPLLTVYTEKSIKLVGGLKINFRTYLDAYLPEIEVVNSNGDEQLLLEYKGNKEQVELTRKTTDENRWLLPNDLYLNEDFYIIIKEELHQGINQAFQIKDDDSSLSTNKECIKRNKYDSSPSPGESFLQGNYIFITEALNTFLDGQAFNPNQNIEIENQKKNDYRENLLLKWLVGKKHTNVQTYNEMYELLSGYNFNNAVTNIIQKRVSTLYLLDNLGYIDYNYSENSIITLPPKLISVPSSQGRKAILTGGRDNKLVKKIIEACAQESSTSVTFKKVTDESTKLIIPDTIILNSNSNKCFKKLALKLGIEYDEWFILKLKCFIPTIEDYENFILKNKCSDSQDDNEWARKVFSFQTLRFEKTDNFSKVYSLVEYAYTTYWKEYGLWIDGNYYRIEDKNWGKYLVVNHYSQKQKVYSKDKLYSRPNLIYIKNDALSIPASLPLPKTMSRILLQVSGEVPEFKELCLNGTKRWYNIYHNIPSLFIDNFFKFKLNMLVENID